MNSAQVVIILINYHNEVDTCACLARLHDLNIRPLQTIVVDNGATEESQKKLAQTWSALGLPFACPETSSPLYSRVIIPCTENGGFSAGNNIGIRFALQNTKCKAVWLLNNDTLPDSNALEALCQCLNQNPEAGIAGSTLVRADAPDIVQCAGGYSFNRLTGTVRPVYGAASAEMLKTIQPEKAEHRLDYICGASMLVRREVFETCGLLAEEYFLYYEDAEYGLRARRAKYKLAWAPLSLVLHKEGGTISAAPAGSPGNAGQTAIPAPACDKSTPFSRPAWADYIQLRNRVYLIRTYYPWALGFMLASLAGVAFNRARGGVSHRIPLLARAVRAGLQGKMGKIEQNDFQRQDKGRRVGKPYEDTCY